MSTIDDSIVRIAERRLHLVTDDEIKQLGLNDRSIRHRISAGRLHRMCPGVLATHGGPWEVSQRELALCLSNPQYVLSHASAAAYWGLRRAAKDRVEVTVPRGVRVRDLDPVVHYSSCLLDEHVVDLVDGARVTSIARTVFDLGGVLDSRGHASLIDDVRNKGLCTDAELGAVYEELCRRGRRGSAAWDRLCTLVERAVRPTMSELELELQTALVAAGLPPAVQQHPVMLPNGRIAHLDLAYPVALLDIEVDHSHWHATPTAVEQDKARDLGLAVLGWERLRFTDRSLERRMPICVATVRAVLERRMSHRRAA